MLLQVVCKTSSAVGDFLVRASEYPVIRRDVVDSRSLLLYKSRNITASSQEKRPGEIEAYLWLDLGSSREKERRREGMMIVAVKVFILWGAGRSGRG